MTPLTADNIEKNLNFEVGERYVRKDLHDVCGGNHQPGISPVRDLSAIFLFSSTSESEFGYKDEWLPNDRFLLTGVGREGDQSWDGLNKSLATHRENDRRVFLFEKVPDRKPTVVTYVGEFEYINHREDTLPDRNGDLRRAYRFEIGPVGDESVAISKNLDEIDLNELYNLARQASKGHFKKEGSSLNKNGKRYSRSDVVKKFALREADGVCQGCYEPAPFNDENDNPYLEVHHLHRLSDDGPDDPDNVTALCPNCHSRVHHGADGDDFNDILIERVNSRSVSLEVPEGN